MARSVGSPRRAASTPTPAFVRPDSPAKVLYWTIPLAMVQNLGRSRKAASTARAARTPSPDSGGGVMRDVCFRLNTVAALALAILEIAATASLAPEWPTHAVRWVLP